MLDKTIMKNLHYIAQVKSLSRRWEQSTVMYARERSNKMRTKQMLTKFGNTGVNGHFRR